MAIRTKAFSVGLRRALADVDLQQETGAMTADAAADARAALIGAERELRDLPEPTWQLPPTPPELHNPQGRQSVFWQEV